MVTKLPSSSEPRPDSEPIGCDTSDLIQVHRIFRWLYGELPGLTLLQGVETMSEDLHEHRPVAETRQRIP